MPLVATALAYIAFIVALPFLLTHPKLRQGIAARLGFYPRAWPHVAAGPRVWVHGASAGDILALLPTVRELKKQQPAIQVIASTITNSGRAMAERQPDLFAAVTYFPYDLFGAVRRALRRIDPNVLVLEYTELWPNLIHAAQRRGIPVVLHNGRLANARMARYRWLFALTGNLLAPLSLLLMRDEREAERALALGAPQQRVFITGNTKFDNLGHTPSADKVAVLRQVAHFPAAAPVWVAGSTHEGEEDALLEVFAQLRKRTANLRMVIAPRYVERCERIVSLASRRGFHARLRSHSQPQAIASAEPDVAAAPESSPEAATTQPATDILVLDTIGELAACYSLATLVFVGGSFVPRGGQNILEPAACGKPVLFGPYMDNFADSVQVLLGRGGIQVNSPQQLARVMQDLLDRDGHRRELGEIAQHQVRTIRGAACRNASLIAQFFRPSAAPSR